MAQELRLLLKAANDLAVDAGCATRNPSELNLRTLQQQVDNYDAAKARYDLAGLSEIVGDAKPA